MIHQLIDICLLFYFYFQLMNTKVKKTHVTTRHSIEIPKLSSKAKQNHFNY